LYYHGNVLRFTAVKANRRLALWIVLGSLAAIVLVAYARERWREPASVHIAVRAQSARPLSQRLSPQPLPAAALPGSAPDLADAPVSRMERGEATAVASPPPPAVRRHEYPRGPPRA
jgi:hypothetical protein